MAGPTTLIDEKAGCAVAVNLALYFSGAARQAGNKGPAFYLKPCRPDPPAGRRRRGCPDDRGKRRPGWRATFTAAAGKHKVHGCPALQHFPWRSLPPSCRHRPHLAPSRAVTGPSHRRSLDLLSCDFGTFFYEGLFCILGNALTPVFHGGHGAQNGLKNNRLVPLAAEPSCTSLRSLKDPTTPNLLCD